jgi:hypothetical protein
MIARLTYSLILFTSFAHAEPLQESSIKAVALADQIGSTREDFSAALTKAFPGSEMGDSTLGNLPADFSSSSWTNTWVFRNDPERLIATCTQIVGHDIAQITLERLFSLEPEDSLHLQQLRFLRHDGNFGPDDQLIPREYSAVLMCDFLIWGNADVLADQSYWKDWFATRFEILNASKFVPSETMRGWGLQADTPRAGDDIFWRGAAMMTSADLTGQIQGGMVSIQFVVFARTPES